MNEKIIIQLLTSDAVNFFHLDFCRNFNDSLFDQKEKFEPFIPSKNEQKAACKSYDRANSGLS